jgi:hypothetical protein
MNSPSFFPASLDFEKKLGKVVDLCFPIGGFYFQPGRRRTTDLGNRAKSVFDFGIASGRQAT